MSVRQLVLCCIAAVVVSTAGCSNNAMTAEDARGFTQQALDRIGYPNAIVDSNVVRARYKSPDPRFRSDPPVDVWQTRAVVAEGQVELYVQRRGDSAVFVRDARADGSRLLTDGQFRALGRFRANPADDRRRDSQGSMRVVGVALVVVVGISLLATVITGTADGRQRAHSARRR